MKNAALLIFSLLSISSTAQNIEKYPYFNNSIALELVAPVSYISSQNTKLYRLPAFFVSYEQRIKNKFYIEGGISFGDRLSGIYVGKSPFDYHESALNGYAGCLVKLKLFHNFYFTPSLDLYYSRVSRFSGDRLDENSNSLTLGPTIGFEYFISKRISLNTDLLNINLGLRFDSESQRSKGYSYATVYKYFSLGVHYNFDWKKKVEPK